MTVLIRNGFVYDPLNGINGEKMDIHVGNGKIVESVDTPETVYDASGKIVMAGGFDIHAHVAGSNLTTARTLEASLLGLKVAQLFPVLLRRAIVTSRWAIRSLCSLECPLSLLGRLTMNLMTFLSWIRLH
jgi:hypothetical protein